jgi:hypothetical protein
VCLLLIQHTSHELQNVISSSILHLPCTCTSSIHLIIDDDKSLRLFQLSTGRRNEFHRPHRFHYQVHFQRRPPNFKVNISYFINSSHPFYTRATLRAIISRASFSQRPRRYFIITKQYTTISDHHHDTFIHYWHTTSHYFSPRASIMIRLIKRAVGRESYAYIHCQYCLFRSLKITIPSREIS